MQTSLRGIFLTVLAGFSWGLSGACGQYLFQNYPFDALLVTTVRLLIAGLILVILNCFKYKKESFAIFKNKKDLLDLVRFAIFGLLPSQLFFLMAVEEANAGTATIMQYSAVILLVIYVCFKEKRSPKFSELAALFLVLTGTILLATRGNFASLYLTPKALTFGFLAALGSAFANVLPDRLIRKYSVKIIIGYGMLFNGILLSIYESTQKIEGTIDLNVLLAMSGIVILGTVIGFDLYFQGVTAIGPAKASMLCSAEPVSATILAAFWLGTVFVPTDIVAIVLVLSAVMILSYEALKKNESKRENLRKKFNRL
jgi:drug/metabolite transporter (DMT)-like permease